jgi:molybdenum cofactor cytidylyltransferase
MIVAVVLAAGLSRRMGRPKLLLDCAGEPAIRRSVARVLAGGIPSGIVVVGPAEARAIEAALAGLPVRCVLNPEPAAGQGSSIAVGIAAMPPGTRAALVALGDQPTVSPAVIRALCDALAASDRAIAAPVYDDGPGNPVLFGTSVFPELLALGGDRGARAVVDRDPARVVVLPVSGPRPPDIDTPGDYAALQERLRAGGESV